MTHIFRVEWYRYRKSKYFRLLALMTLGIPVMAGLILIFLKTTNQQNGTEFLNVTPKLFFPFLFGYSSIFLFFSLLFEVLFIAQDFSYGTVVNKLYCGYTRREIYSGSLSFHVLVTLVANFLFGIIYIVFSGLLLSDFSIGWGNCLYYLAAHLWATLLASLFVYCVAFWNQKTVTGIIISVAMLYVGFFIAGLSTEIQAGVEKYTVLKTIFQCLPHFQTADIFSSGGIAALLDSSKNNIAYSAQHIWFWILTPVYSAIAVIVSGRKFCHSDIRLN